jgi:hypothetical protein
MYDLKAQGDVYLKIFSSTTSNGSLTQVRRVAATRFGNDDSDLNSYEVSMILKIDSANYYTFAFYSDDTNPYALASPGDEMYTMSMQITKVRSL